MAQEMLLKVGVPLSEWGTSLCVDEGAESLHLAADQSSLPIGRCGTRGLAKTAS